MFFWLFSLLLTAFVFLLLDILSLLNSQISEHSKGLVLASLFLAISAPLLDTPHHFHGFANHPDDDFQTYFISSTNLHVYIASLLLDMKFDNL